ncbi:hypothetical protein [Lewinella sp. LCG006]|uniref:hypothetical protein n=1 Tax=Lewinella sp. LCG006 TaxID=3231911 RepID=UPI003460C2B1
MTNLDTASNASSQSVFAALKQGISAACRQWWMSLLLWATTLVLALLAAIPVRSLLAAEAGKSLMIKDLVKGFDYTFLNDFMQNYGSGFTPMLNQSLLLLAVQYLLLVFFVGGIVKVLWEQPSQDQRPMFWSSSARYFWRMLRLSLFFLVVHLLVLVIFGLLYMQVTKGLSPKALDSEGIITSSLRWLVPLYVLVAAVPMMWQDYAKVYLVKNDHRFIWSPIGEAGRFLIRRFPKAYPLYLLNIGILLLLFAVNYFLTGLFEISSLSTIIGAFILSQLFVFARYGLKIVNQGSIVGLLR